MNDNYYLELISREVFQAVINPNAAIKRWDSIKEVFSNFNIDIVAGMDEKEIGRLMKNEKIIRNRKKIKATIENAEELKIIENQYGSFENYISNFKDDECLLDDLTKRIHYIGKLSVRRILKSIRCNNSGM